MHLLILHTHKKVSIVLIEVILATVEDKLKYIKI